MYIRWQIRGAEAEILSADLDESVIGKASGLSLTRKFVPPRVCHRGNSVLRLGKR